MSVVEHRQRAPRAVRLFLMTVSDTRTAADDHAGQAAQARVVAAGHLVAGYAIVKDDPAAVVALIQRLVDEKQAQIIVTCGGTGITARDSTYEAVTALLEKRLDGFGELFRLLSYQEIGAAAMLSRAVAGLYRGVVLFATPGSTAAVTLALDKLILPEAGHLVAEARR